MKFPIADIVYQERKLLDWDQAHLAAQLGIGQQTVSRWERGTSRPKRDMVARLAELFDRDVDELLKAAGYLSPTADTPGQVPPPVRPRSSNLPLAELAPDRFEQFSADLVQRLWPDAKVHRFGSQGHKQDGIDVIAYHPDGRISVVQCKRHAQFGPSKIQAAVADVNVVTDEHLLFLTRTASPEARIEIAKHKSWALWDIDDIARHVRSLPTESAVRLVDTYFPGWREPFLGIREPGPWLTSDEFFLPFSGQGLFSHDWELVGRTDDLATLVSFATGQPRLAGISGRGGIGKTRLLRAIAGALEHSGAAEVRFLGTGVDVNPEHFELLPSATSLLIVIDDAHERSDLVEVLGGVYRHRPQAKVLLAIRPYGLAQLAYDAGRVGLHPLEYPIVHLDDLKPSEAESLAREILGASADPFVVEQLAALTNDCPLITVIGAGLIARGDLDPQQLGRDDSVRTQILHSYRVAIIGDPASGDPELRRAVLDAASILQPVRIGEPTIRVALEQLTSEPFDRVMRHLRSLEDAGVLLRRGQSLRIVPDLLGDIVLSEACFDERSGVPTGYIERVERSANGTALQHVLTNASRLDWQLRHDSGASVALVDSLWSSVEGEFRSAGTRGRLELARLLQSVAFFQPARALALVRWAIEHPTADVEDMDDPLSKIYPPSYEDVLRELPPLLKYVAYSYDVLPDAVDLLWRLAQLDLRPTNSHPDHALRLLAELAGYDNAKPIEFNVALIDAAERWFADDRVVELPHSPFDVLEPVLATEGTSHSSEGITITIKPYLINPDAVRELRQRVVDLALVEARSNDPRRAVRAVKALEHSIRYPMGLAGSQVDADQRSVWTPLFVVTIAQLGDVASDESLDPVVGVAACRALRWHADYSTTETRAAARHALDRIPGSIESQVALALHDGWGQLLFEHLDDYEEAERRKREWFEALATRLITEQTDEQIVAMVAQRLKVQSRGFASNEGNAGPFAWTLVRLKPSLGEHICRQVAGAPESPLLPVVPVVLSQLAAVQHPTTMGLARQLVGSGSTLVTQHVALAFGWNRGARQDLLDGEFDLLSEFAVNRDVAVRRSAVRAAEVLASERRTAAIDLLTRVPFVDSLEVAEDVFSCFGVHGAIEWAALTKSQADAFLEQLRTCPSIEDYHVTDFLAQLSVNQPLAVVDLLKARIEHSEPDVSIADFRPLPYHWQTTLQIRDHPQFIPALRSIRDWINERPDSWQRLTMGADLFRAVAVTFDRPVLEVLDEGISSGLKSQLDAVSAILHEAPRNLILEDVDFVTRALAAAAGHGEDALRHMRGSLHAAVVSGSRSGTPGQPFSEDIEQRDKCTAIADSLARGSIEERFYRGLVRSADESIQWHAEQDEQFIDPRDW